MASNNVETLRAAHESWNRRDFQGVVRNAAEDLVYTDHARALTLNNRDKFRQWTESWAKAFSDGRITNSEYIDAGTWSLPDSPLKAPMMGRSIRSNQRIAAYPYRSAK